MKNLIMILVFVIFFSEVSSQTKEFTISYSGCYPVDSDSSTRATNWHWYDELNVNLWEGYGIGEVSRHGYILDSLYSHNINGYFQPDTLMQFAFGKVIIHQAEEITLDNFRYNYHNSGKDTTETFMGETETVRYFEVNTVPVNERGISDAVLTGIKENAMQSFSGLVLDPKKQWRWDNTIGQYPNSWYIKPRMRIDSNDAHGAVKNVVKIVVRAFNGDVIFELNITTDRFLNASGEYNGKYLEDFFINGINIKGDTSSIGINKGFPPNLDHRDKYQYFDSCKVDFEIHWYKDVSVWIDYVKIMDEPANLLFSPNPDIRNAIKGQIQRLMNHSGGNKVKGFYTEEIDYSRLTCLKYLQDFLKD